MTQPEIYIGFTPSLNAGHGNHQQAGRYIWEGVKAAADPTMFPEQLRGRNALAPGRSRRSSPAAAPPGTGGTTTAPALHDRLRPAPPTNLRHGGRRRGRATTRRTCWPRGQRPGPAGGHAEELGAGRAWRARAPTRRRAASCARASSRPAARASGMTDAFVPFQPNLNADGTANPRPAATTRSSTAPSGATRAGCRSARSSTSTLSDFFNAPGAPFQATVHVRSGRGHAARAAASRSRSRRAGRSSPPQRVGPISSRRETTVDVRRHAGRGRRGQHATTGSPRCYRTGGRHGLHGHRRARRARRSRAASSAGASGRSTTTGSRAPRRARCASAAPPPRSRSASARRSPSRSTSTTGRPRAQTGTVELTPAGGLHRRRDLQAVRHARARRGHDRRVRSSPTPTRRCPPTQTATIPITHDATARRPARAART